MLWDGQPGVIALRAMTSVPPTSDPFEELRRLSGPPDKRQSVSYKIVVGWLALTQKDYLARDFGVYVVWKEELTNHYATEGDLEADIGTVVKRDFSEALILDDGSKDMVDVKKDVQTGETILSLARPPFPLNPQVAEFRQAFVSWAIYEDLWAKVYSGRVSFSFQSSVRLPSVTRYETSLSLDGTNLVSFLHTLYLNDKSFRIQIDDAMQAAFGGDFVELNFAPAGDQLIQLRIRWKSLRHDVSAADLSDGTLRFLFLVAALANPSPPPLIVIEEPEIGLHPSMLPIVAEYAVDAASRTQVVFTTHSPDFLTAFRDTVPTTTVFSWEDGQTVLRVLKDEDLKYWLKEYTLGQFAFSGAAEAVE